MSGITLYGIEQALLDLAAIVTDPEAAPEEREVAEQELQRYLAAEVAKVDGVRAFVRHCEAMAAEADKEAKATAQRAKIWQNRADRVKGFAMAAMQEAGKTKLEGAAGSLSIQANGGLQALTITDPALVPDEYKTFTLEMAHAEWKVLKPICDRHRIGPARAVVSNKLVRAALEADCEHCNSRGELSMPDAELITCAACDGTGQGFVPGARLEPRGQQLRVR